MFVLQYSDNTFVGRDQRGFVAAFTSAADPEVIWFDDLEKAKAFASQCWRPDLTEGARVVYAERLVPPPAAPSALGYVDPESEVRKLNAELGSKALMLAQAQLLNIDLQNDLMAAKQALTERRRKTPSWNFTLEFVLRLQEALAEAQAACKRMREQRNRLLDDPKLLATMEKRIKELEAHLVQAGAQPPRETAQIKQLEAHIQTLNEKLGAEKGNTFRARERENRAVAELEALRTRVRNLP